MNDRTDRLASLRRTAMAAPMLDADEEIELIHRTRRGDQRALGRLLDSHLRLVLAVARRYAGNGISTEDLVSEGNLGLVEAAHRFDAERGTRFGTYAAWWVRAHIRRYALANRRIVATPSTRNARKVLSRLRATQRELAQAAGRSAERSTVAEELGVTEEDIAMVEAALSGRDVPIGFGEDGAPSFDVVDASPSPEQLAAEDETRELHRDAVAEALDELSEREREIVRRRFFEDEGTTLAVLGEVFGLSRERVRQIEKRAQRKLRSALTERVA